MTFLDDITGAEREAEKIRKNAQGEATERVQKAQDEQVNTLERLRGGYNEQERIKKDEALVRADKKGATLVEKGKKELQTIRTRAEKNMPQAVQCILENL